MRCFLRLQSAHAFPTAEEPAGAVSTIFSFFSDFGSTVRANALEYLRPKIKGRRTAERQWECGSGEQECQ